MDFDRNSMTAPVQSSDYTKKFFFQAAVLHIHHIAVVGLLFQLGKFFFGQRVVAEEGALADIIQITRMNEGFFRERGLFLNGGKFFLLLVETLQEQGTGRHRQGDCHAGQPEQEVGIQAPAGRCRKACPAKERQASPEEVV